MDRTYELILMAQNGDKSARDILVQENMGLVWSVVKRFAGRGYEPEDLFQIGAIGLIKCIDKFDTAFLVKFSTYAIPMIIGEIKRFLRDDGMIKVSRPLKELAVKAKHMEEKLQHQTGKSPTISELAVALDADVEDLVVAMEASFEVESLHSTVNQKDGSTVFLIDKLNQGEDGDHMVELIALRQIIKSLPPKEQQVIMMRYFEDKTQVQVAQSLGVSQVQVSRIEKKVLNTIREAFV